MYLPDDMHSYLAHEASERGISMAEVAREAIAQYRVMRAEEHRPSIGALVGVLSDGLAETDLASQVDSGLDVYYAPGGAWEQEHGVAAAD